MSLYAALAIPELWRYDGKNITFYQLEDGRYQAVDRSFSFPILTATKVREFLDDCQSLGVSDTVRHLRDWISIQIAD